MNPLRCLVGLTTVLLLMLAGCAQLPGGVEPPQIKVTGLSLLPARGLQQPIAVQLRITNPNGRDLSPKGISYKIGLENIDLLTGVTSQVPTLKAYEETPVTVEVSAGLLAMARLLEQVSRGGLSEKLNYNFEAKLDFNRWLPAMRVQETGAIRLHR